MASQQAASFSQPCLPPIIQLTTYTGREPTGKEADHPQPAKARATASASLPKVIFAAALASSAEAAKMPSKQIVVVLPFVVSGHAVTPDGSPATALVMAMPLDEHSLFGVCSADTRGNNHVAFAEGEEVLKSLALPHAAHPPYLMGRIEDPEHNSAFVVLAPHFEDACASDQLCFQPSDMMWRTPSECKIKSVAYIVNIAAERVRYCTTPSPALPLTYHTGRMQPAQFNQKFLPPPAEVVNFEDLVQRANTANSELKTFLATVDRGDDGYRKFLDKCMSRIEMCPIADIPPSLRKQASTINSRSIAMAKYEHDTWRHTTQPLLPRPDVPCLYKVPQCDAEIFTDEFLCEFDKKGCECTKFHNGLRATRPTALYAGLECIRTPELKAFFAAGGGLDCSRGPGKIRELKDTERFPSTWNLRYVADLLERSPDKQLKDLWCEGIDLLDDLRYDAVNDNYYWDTQFVMGMVPNMLSAYGCSPETGIDTSTAEAQETSDKIAKELKTFIEHDPPLYSKPIPLLSDPPAFHCRFGTVPFINDPLGQVPKKGSEIRVVINMCNPEEGGTTMAGDTVVSKNQRAELHPTQEYKNRSPASCLPWKHTGEPKPSCATAARGSSTVTALANTGGHATYTVGIDGWKMFHQFDWCLRMLTKTGALVPLTVKTAEGLKALGLSNTFVAAMGASPMSQDCQRALNELAYDFYMKFDALDAPFLKQENKELQACMLERAAYEHNAFGTHSRLAFCVVYTDDPKIDVAGPPPRLERALFAIYNSFGDGGACMVLADHLKWLLGSHGLWCGVYSSPMLGIQWFDRSKRIKAIDAIGLCLTPVRCPDSVVRSSITEGDFKKLVSFLEYVVTIANLHPYMVRPLWRSISPPRARGNAELTHLISEERGKLRVLRKTITNVPGAPLHSFSLSKPTSYAQGDDVEWLSQTDARLEFPLCGLGGCVYNKLWKCRIPPAWLDVVTIPLAEFFAHIGGKAISHQVAPDANRYVDEIDAIATPTALVTIATATTLRIAHEEYMKTELYKLTHSRSFVRHLWGHGNPTADEASRDNDSTAEDLVAALGMQPEWMPLPNFVWDLFCTIVDRLRARLDNPFVPAAKELEDTRSSNVSKDGAPFRMIDVGQAAAAHAEKTASEQLAPASHPSSLMAGGKRLIDPPSPPQFKRSPPPPVSPKRSPARVLGAAARSAFQAITVPDPSTTTHIVPVHNDPPPLPNLANLQIAPEGASTWRHVTWQHVGVPECSDEKLGLVFPTESPSTQLPDLALSAAAGSIKSGPPALPTRVLQDRLASLIRIADEREPVAPEDPGLREQVLHDYLLATHMAAPSSTLDKEDGAWKRYWVPYCKAMGISEVRSNMESHSGRDFEGFMLESAYMAGFLTYVMGRMQPRKGWTTPPKPTSGLKVCGHIRRIHLKRYHLPHFVPLTAAVQACDGMCKKYIQDNGADAFYPHRKEPLTNEIIGAIFDLFNNCAKVGRRTISRYHPAWASLEAMFHMHAQTGMRKAETSLPPGAKWDRSRISFANIRWQIGNKVYASLTPEQLRNLTANDYCLLTPPPSKADPLGLHWGACTIYLRFSSTDKICAARALAHLELVRAVPIDKRLDTPLFVDFEGGPTRQGVVTDMFKKMLILALRSLGMDEQLASRYSMHSWRIYLACALLEAGASHATILAMLRWRSEDALKLYARMNDSKYADWLAKASQAEISNIRTTTIADHMADVGAVGGIHAAAFTDSWLRLAAQSTDVAAHKDNLPVHDESQFMANLHATSRDLWQLAEKEDAL